MQEVIQTLVHCSGDDFHQGEGVGHRVHTQLSHQQRNQHDLVLLHLVVLSKPNTKGTNVKDRPLRQQPLGVAE